jgi:hypothetical protein
MKPRVRVPISICRHHTDRMEGASNVVTIKAPRGSVVVPPQDEKSPVLGWLIRVLIGVLCFAFGVLTGTVLAA